jgi:excisionase family DNA binding protein
LSHFLRQLSILGFTLRKRSPEPDDGLRGAGKNWHLQQNEVAMEDRLLYRVPEVAVILNISRSKVYELFSSGDLQSVKIDRIRLVRSSDLRAYVDGLRPADKST